MVSKFYRDAQARLIKLFVELKSLRETGKEQSVQQSRDGKLCERWVFEVDDAVQTIGVDDDS